MATQNKEDGPRLNINENNRRMLESQIDDISRVLEQVSVTERLRMPEREFVGAWLPFFAGGNNLYDADMGKWLGRVGGPGWSVDVIGANGETLFTVPPVINPAFIKPVMDAAAPVAAIISTAAQHAQLHPNQGRLFLEHHLTSKLRAMSTSKSGKSDLEIWNEIFVRYGFDAIPTTAVAATGTPTKPDDKLTEEDYTFE